MRKRPAFLASSLPTVDDWAELSEVGWGTSWAVVGSALETMVEGCGADADWIRQSDEVAVRRRQRAERVTARAVAQAQWALRRAADREAERLAQAAQIAQAHAVSAHVRELRELRYELEALRAKQTLREYRRTHPYGVEFFGPVGTHGEPEWHPINMGLKSEAEAVALAEHFTRVQGIQARAVAW